MNSWPVEVGAVFVSIRQLGVAAWPQYISFLTAGFDLTAERPSAEAVGQATQSCVLWRLPEILDIAFRL